MAPPRLVASRATIVPLTLPPPDGVPRVRTARRALVWRPRLPSARCHPRRSGTSPRLEQAEGHNRCHHLTLVATTWLRRRACDPRLPPPASLAPLCAPCRPTPTTICRRRRHMLVPARVRVRMLVQVLVLWVVVTPLLRTWATVWPRVGGLCTSPGCSCRLHRTVLGASPTTTLPTRQPGTTCRWGPRSRTSPSPLADGARAPPAGISCPPPACSERRPPDTVYHRGRRPITLAPVLAPVGGIQCPWWWWGRGAAPAAWLQPRSATTSTHGDA